MRSGGLEPIKESKESMSYTYNSNPMNASAIANKNAIRPDMNPTPQTMTKGTSNND